jgi:glycosyltransferase involved in cell wall biosynthesis
MLPKVSVMMPARNSEKYIGEAIESIINQTHSNLELLIVDDKSTDATYSIANEFAKKDDRIHIIKGDGICAANARNKALDAATGEFIMNMDSDDVSVPDRIERLLNVALQYNMCVVGSNVQYTDMYLHPIKRSNFPLSNADIRNGFKRVINRFTFMPGTIFTKTSLLRKFRYYEFYRILEDWDLILRLSESADNVFVNIKEPLYIYRRNTGSVTLTHTPRIRYNLFIRYNEIQRRKKKIEICSLAEFESKVKKRLLSRIIYMTLFMCKKMQHILFLIKTKWIFNALKEN